MNNKLLFCLLDHHSQESSRTTKAQLTHALNNAIYSNIPFIGGLSIFVTYFYYGETHLTVPLVVGTMSIIFAIRMEVTRFFTSAILGYSEGKTSCRRIQVSMSIFFFDQNKKKIYELMFEFIDKKL